ncbi:MAG: DoxX family protein, partial [Hyphomicrobiaceae bacterium]
SGVGKALGFAGTSAMLASKGFPAPDLVLVLTILIEVGGGLLLVVGWNMRYAAVVLAAFTIAAGIIFHDFWRRRGGPPAEHTNQLNHFMKNVAIAGGLLVVAARRQEPRDVA